MPDSFYGGRPGYSFVIVINYPSVEEMVENFQKGPDYEAVHFNEHVLINTENKNDPDNGKIYRRGYDYHNDMGGAVYIGTIVGPAGRAPMLEMTTIEDVKSKQAEEGYDYRYTEGEYAPYDNLVPGKVDDDTYNDSIQWACCCIRNENDEDSIAYIGFIIPYLVVDYTADSVDPYYNRDNDSDVFTNENLVDREDDGEHPFYEHWHISVPKGIKGESLNNFRVMIADDTIQSYDGQQDDIDNKREVLVYDYYNYDNNETGDPVTIYLGDYNMITGITIDDDGTITIEYSHDDDLQYSNKFKWIKEVTLDTENGHFTVVYNYEEDGEGNPTTYETDLAWVSGIDIAEDGTVTIHHITGDTDTLETIVRWIDYIEMLADGSVRFHYNDGTEQDFDELIEWINDIYIETTDESGEEGTGDQKVHVIFDTGEEVVLGEPLNYIMEMSMVDSDYHLLVWYSDPAKRQQLIDDGLSYTHNGKDGWFDLGAVKDDSGILVGMNISAEEYPIMEDIESAIEHLNEYYPEGLEGTDLHGKVVTVGDSEENKRFYAFDYNIVDGEYVGWYYLGVLTDDPTAMLIVGAEDDDEIHSLQNNLSVYGWWFVVEDL